MRALRVLIVLIILAVAFVLLSLLVFLFSPINVIPPPPAAGVQAQPTTTAIPSTPTAVRSGPDIERFTVEPREAKVGDVIVVDVAIKKIPGATRIIASCGRTGHFERPEIQTYTTAWDTKDCAPGEQTIRLITRWQGDTDWKAWPDSKVIEVRLLPSPVKLDNPLPEARLRVDRGDGRAFHTGIRQGQCVVLSWGVVNAKQARLNGRLVTLKGSGEECPEKTVYYTLEAFGDDEGYSNSRVSVVVTQ